VAWERVTLHGLMIYAKRPVTYGPIDPKLARELLIREGLVAGPGAARSWVRTWRFFQHNRQIGEATSRQLEHKTRRQDVLVDEELIHRLLRRAGFPPRHHHPGEPSTTGGKRGGSGRTRSCSAWKSEQFMRHDAAGVTSDAFPPQSWSHPRPAASGWATTSIRAPRTTASR
jgi:ATP-dependent helicase HrpA